MWTSRLYTQFFVVSSMAIYAEQMQGGSNHIIYDTARTPLRVLLVIHTRDLSRFRVWRRVSLYIFSSHAYAPAPVGQLGYTRGPRQNKDRQACDV
jgi:hypothetical protein